MFTHLVLAVALLSATHADEKPANALIGEWSLREAKGSELATSLKTNITRISIDEENFTAGRAAEYQVDEAKSFLTLKLTTGPKAEQGIYKGFYTKTAGALTIAFAALGKDRPTSATDVPPGGFVLVLAKK